MNKIIKIYIEYIYMYIPYAIILSIVNIYRTYERIGTKWNNKIEEEI